MARFLWIRLNFGLDFVSRIFISIPDVNFPAGWRKVILPELPKFRTDFERRLHCVSRVFKKTPRHRRRAFENLEVYFALNLLSYLPNRRQNVFSTGLIFKETFQVGRADAPSLLRLYPNIYFNAHLEQLGALITIPPQAPSTY